ncbi:hypothetical protein [Morganella psychrotolerans]|uniref:hypothetical protein n=1 Tax=Morganella psychrotolerans TaxID=368603 RepID=UPI000AFD9091|nr:hypothetical protein [Morganella psychrotolerans]
METTDLHLVQIITTAGHDPSDITDSVWSAGYRKTDFTTDQIIEMAVRRGAECQYLFVPDEAYPKTVEDLSMWELNDIIVEAQENGSSAAVAKQYW